VSTKEKIVKTALNVFNRRGTELVTVRELAQEVGISHGNLCYHFPTTDDIVRHLYYALVAELDAEIQSMQGQTQNPAEIFKGTRALFELLYKYRFIMINFVDFMRRMPDINKHFRKLQQRRREEFKQLFGMLGSAGLMRPELYPGFFDDLNLNMSILGDFWISHAEIHFTGKEKDKLDFYYRVTSSFFLPTLTEKGLALFLKSQ
jgi:AcrR family transcriptional regulator